MGRLGEGDPAGTETLFGTAAAFKVYRQRGPLSKEVEGDYKYDATVITGIERSLGQNFYKVQGEGKPFLRADILLIKENEAAPAAAAPEGGEAEPYMSYKRKRIIQREKNKEIRENKAKLAQEAKDAVKKAKADARAIVAATKAKVIADASAEWDDFAKSLAERGRLRKGVPARGVNQVGGSSGSGLAR